MGESRDVPPTAFGDSAGLAQDVEQVADRVLVLQLVAKTLAAVNGVVVATSFFFDLEDLVLDQLRKDALNRPLRDAHFIGKVANAGVGVTR